MRLPIALILAISIVVSCKQQEEKELLPGYTMLSNPTSDSMVGKLFTGNDAIGYPCSSIKTAHGWEHAATLIGSHDSVALKGAIQKIIDFQFGFTKNKIVSKSIDSITFQYVEDLSLLSLPDSGAIIISAAIAVNSFTVDIKDQNGFKIVTSSLRQNIPDIKIETGENTAVIKSGKGIVVAVKCIVIDKSEHWTQYIGWVNNKTEVNDTVYNVKNYISFATDPQPTDALSMFQIHFVSGKFRTNGSPKDEMLRFSPNKEQIDLKNSGIAPSAAIINFEEFARDRPTRISGGTIGPDIVTYDIMINSALISYRDVSYYKSPLDKSRLATGGKLKNSRGNITLITTKWTYHYLSS